MKGWLLNNVTGARDYLRKRADMDLRKADMEHLQQDAYPPKI